MGHPTRSGGLGMKVWLTRTRPGADRQARDLEAAGYQVLAAPVLDIEPVESPLPAGAFQVVVFLSEHAVRHGLARVASLSWFEGARRLAVGARTAAVLQARGFTAEVPAEPDSEGLLSLLGAVEGCRVLLVTGAGGRALLGRELAARGAEAARFECYRRVAATALPAGVTGCDVIIAASAEGLERAAALWLGAGGRADVPVLVPSARVAGRGVELGLANLHDCGGADSEAWLRGLEQLPSTGTS